MMRLLAIFALLSLAARSQGGRLPADHADAGDDLLAYLAIGGVT